jgi:putative inorganic carbon (hco3(-)) transporter
MLSSIYQYIYQQIVHKKMNSPLGIFLFVAFSFFLSYIIVFGNYRLGPLVIGILGGAIIFLSCIISPLSGFYITSFISLFAFFPERLLGTPVPLSVGIEFLILGVYLGLLLKNRRSAINNMGFYKAPSSLAMIFFLVFLLIEGFNPNMHSIPGWLFYIRRYLEFLLIYYAGYMLIDTLDKVKYFIRFWILLGLLNALYTCKQQWFGFFGFEMNWLRNDPHLIALYFQGGVFRKFSFLSDPAANGIWMASMAIFTLILAMGEKNKKRRRFYFIGSFFSALAMEYTGTRTSTVILLGGWIFYILMTLNNKMTFYFSVASVLLFMFLLAAPIDNPTLNRLRSSFRGSKDESLEVRNINRRHIQPYILAHPMGGGVATSSSEGLVYNPGHPLAGFPPDSGFLKLAIETGWIGYAIALFYYFILICQGVHFYFKAQNKQIKLYILAFTAAILIFILAQYTQVSIGQFPGIFFFYPAAALLIRLLQLDNAMLDSRNDKTNL